MRRRFLSVDVGTASARAAVVDEAGEVLAVGTHPLAVATPLDRHVECSSRDVWAAVVASVKAALRKTPPGPDVLGIGFDATCSLVLVGADDEPISVTLHPVAGTPVRDIIVWMDHRANEEADEINRKAHPVLQSVGSRISPEMQAPKLLWLKRHMPDAYERVEKYGAASAFCLVIYPDQMVRFFDLSDYLAYRAVGVDRGRSLCTVACKWTYNGAMAMAECSREANVEREGKLDEPGWDAGFFQSIGLGDHVDDSFERIGSHVFQLGDRVGSLCAEAAAALGLPAGITVSCPVVDAHAGALGLLAAHPDGQDNDSLDFNKRLALLAGTSGCHMAVSQRSSLIDGVWGPYFSALVPGFWLNEGGQSCFGSLLDFVVLSHVASTSLIAQLGYGDAPHSESMAHIYRHLNAVLESLCAADHDGRREVPLAELTRDIHVLPYFHGNRSPRADSSLRGVMTGIILHAVDSVEHLALNYLATLQALCYGTRHIIEVMNGAGYEIQCLLASGGITRNPLFNQQMCDITGCAMAVGSEQAMFTGTAVLTSVACGVHPSVPDAMQAMNRCTRAVYPRAEAAAYHDRKYRVFHALYEDYMKYRDIMAEPS